MILGIAGKLESGKTTVANYLVKEYGYTEMAFAKNLKEMCMIVFNLTAHQVFSTEGKFEKFKQPIKLECNHIVQLIHWITEVNKWPMDQVDKVKMYKLTTGGVTFDTTRHVLQFIGTEICRDCVDDAFHAKVLFNQIADQKLQNVVISDARFANERTMIQENGGQNMLVDCVQTQDQTSAHKSENDLGVPEDYDYVVHNDKTKGFDYLYYNIVQLMG